MNPYETISAGYELSAYYFGNKPQHKGHDDSDPFSDEYRVAIIEMSDGSTVYDLWCNGDLYGERFSTEAKAKKALRDEWKNNLQDPD